MASWKSGYICRDFYPRSPCGERQSARSLFSIVFTFLSTLSLRRATIKNSPALLSNDQFLSTLSLRRATSSAPYAELRSVYFYPRSPCGERPWARGSRTTYVEFLSTLSLRRATLTLSMGVILISFLSTLSLRRATKRAKNNYKKNKISIHALLAESDIVYALKLANTMLFLSTLSLRRATIVNNIIFMPGEFLSTLSLRRATRR